MPPDIWNTVAVYSSQSGWGLCGMSVGRERDLYIERNSTPFPFNVYTSIYEVLCLQCGREAGQVKQ